jgi:hypothetical protein
VPWLEPDDYPTGENREFLEFAAEAERGYSSEEIMEYFQTRQLNWDRFLLSVADVVGIILFPGGDPRDAVRPDARPLLWNDSVEPLAIWCRQNDWWLERGTKRLKIFNSAASAFEEQVTIGGTPYPILQFVQAGSAGAPVIVP